MPRRHPHTPKVIVRDFGYAATDPRHWGKPAGAELSPAETQASLLSIASSSSSSSSSSQLLDRRQDVDLDAACVAGIAKALVGCPATAPGLRLAKGLLNFKKGSEWEMSLHCDEVIVVIPPVPEPEPEPREEGRPCSSSSGETQGSLDRWASIEEEEGGDGLASAAGNGCVTTTRTVVLESDVAAVARRIAECAGSVETYGSGWVVGIRVSAASLGGGGVGGCSEVGSVKVEVVEVGLLPSGYITLL